MKAFKKIKCSEGVCNYIKESIYYCKRMDEKTGIFEVTDDGSWLFIFNTFHTFKCFYVNKNVTWTEYNFEAIMKEIIKKHEENK